jgi:sporulation protein YlmC with PRC-barrel domain
MAYDDRTPMSNASNSGSGSGSQGALVHTRDLEHFTIPDGQPDPRGWSVKSSDGTTLGKVEDLLFDTGEQRVRYIEVRADGDITKQGGRDYFLLPIGTAQLDDEHDDVVVNLSAADFSGVPAYERGKVSREYESSLRDYVRDRPGSQPRVASADREVSFYGSPEYDDARFFSRNRSRSAGTMGASSGGLGDRLADKVDDLKDRVDGNPASRPGPDPTDRRY